EISYLYVNRPAGRFGFYDAMHILELDLDVGGFREQAACCVSFDDGTVGRPQLRAAVEIGSLDPPVRRPEDDVSFPAPRDLHVEVDGGIPHKQPAHVRALRGSDSPLVLLDHHLDPAADPLGQGRKKAQQGLLSRPDNDFVAVPRLIREPAITAQHRNLLPWLQDKGPFNLLKHALAAQPAGDEGNRPQRQDAKASDQDHPADPGHCSFPSLFFDSLSICWISIAQPIAVGTSPAINQGPTPKVRSPSVMATPTNVTVIGDACPIWESAPAPSPRSQSGGTSPFSIIAIRSLCLRYWRNAA